LKYGPIIHKEPDIPLDFHIYYEQRSSVRIAMLKTKINLRIPIMTSTPEKEKYLAWGVQWAKNRIKKTQGRVVSPERTYSSGDELNAMGMKINIQIHLNDKQVATAKWQNPILKLSIPTSWTEEEKQDTARKLVRKILCSMLMDKVTTRVMELNALHFKKHINDIKIKYNVSNWGSCSRKSNINLSLRLFFAPTSVIDYVIIHELAHLIEPNHSHRFWKLVAQADPNYMDSEKWLKDNSYAPLV